MAALNDWRIELDGTVTFGPSCLTVGNPPDWQKLLAARMISDIPASHEIADGRVSRIGATGNTRDRKVSDDDVQRLRYEYFIDGVTQKTLAARYGISQPSVSKIVSWRTKWTV